ncbi:MAG: hypothetical protein ACJASX_001200 [Limisphaerales bacterium]|jgi:hypothetical protein
MTLLPHKKSAAEAALLEPLIVTVVLEIHQLDIEHESRVGRNHTTGTT